MRQLIETDLLILGAGAAGMMCAMTAGQRGRSVHILDHAGEPGEKIRISGGGRCNFTNLRCGPQNFLSANPHFCISALRQYTQHDFLAMVARHKIAWHEKTLGQLFCDGSAKEIIAMLRAECAASGVTMHLATEVGEIARNADARFVVETSAGQFHAQSLVVATGGKSIPKMGATGRAYDIARQFGLEIISPRAGLVPLVFTSEFAERLKQLAGIAVAARVRFGKVSFDEAVLMTHRGMSGPAILQISSYWRDGEPVSIDLAPGKPMLTWLSEAKQSTPRQLPATLLSQIMPRRLAQFIAEGAVPRDKNLGDLSANALAGLAAAVSDWRVLPAGTEGFRTAEVTLGGIATDALSSKTMQARDVPGLYFIGEALDVTGHLGGHNFQWAWSSGYAAGMAV